MPPSIAGNRHLSLAVTLGEATAAAVADHTGLGYSTVTPKLRAWETTGHSRLAAKTLKVRTDQP